MLTWFTEDVSTYGPQVDSLFYLIFWITTVTFVLVEGTLIVFLVKYRHTPGRQATYTHGNNTLEIAWTIAPALILVPLALLSRATWHEIKESMPPSNYEVLVTAKQFNWEITYPGPDGQFGTADDKTVENDMNVPVNQVIRVHLKSKDVIHSFFVPVLRLKQDALPGREILQWFQVTTPGRYEIPCAELCGFGHSGMKGHLYVHSAADYEAWQKQQWPPKDAAGTAQADTTDAKKG
jgi:cytochrome c oxidase subunit 2